MFRLAVAAALGLLVLALLPADSRGPAAATAPYTARVVVPGIASDEPHAASRTYGMGFFVQPSRPTVAAVIEMVPKMAKVSDYAMIQREVPWTKIAAGLSIEQIIAEDYTGLANFLRGNGMKLALLVDPLDGLDRTSEAVEAVKNGRTLKDASTRAIHEAWVLALVSALKPEYVGLASEINTMRAQGDKALYEIIRDMCNRLAPQVRQLSPGSRVFVSFQVDNAWQVAPWPKSPVDQFALTREFDVDVIGLSSYPGFSFPTPADIPLDYYRRFQLESGKPLLMAEGGWGSAGGAYNSPANQAAYYERMFDLLDGVQAELAILLLYPDLDLSDPAWGLTDERAATLAHFASMGIVDMAGAQKPVYPVWAERFQRALAPR
ncbi:MAG: hypothetical protein HUU14_12620 [Dehalococcoidia bacterium]|nr:hypothetical protein [Chloroflexi bacterium CFX7]MCK6565753.1 hypothetical protein [Dehalococcoidia bacterium]NUQ56725.1 hypothetical protein [Dehalococcoidia bacterium]